MIPARFVTEYPKRCMELFEVLEGLARQKELVGSFSLVVATSVFLIPYERMKATHPLHRPEEEAGIYRAIRRAERQKFLEGEFWKKRPHQTWRYSRIMNNANRTLEWRDASDRHPMDAGAKNLINERCVNDVLRVLRNSLAHGNVVYLDETGFEKIGAKVQHLAFLSRYEESAERREQSETYRLVVTTEEGFLHFVKSWATWLSGMSQDLRLVQAAE